jgi:hypothetical protein
MRSRTRRSFIKVAVGALAAIGLPAWADDTKDAKGPAGTWAKKDGEVRLEFADKETLRIRPHGDKAEFTVVCSYAVKDGVVKAKITELEGKAEILEKAKPHLPVGREFSFAWTAKDDTATLADLTGKDTDGLKGHLEGEYAKK